MVGAIKGGVVSALRRRGLGCVRESSPTVRAEGNVGRDVLLLAQALRVSGDGLVEVLGEVVPEMPPISKQIEGVVSVDVDQHCALDMSAAQGEILDPQHCHEPDPRVRKARINHNTVLRLRGQPPRRGQPCPGPTSQRQPPRLHPVAHEARCTAHSAQSDQRLAQRLSAPHRP